MATFLSQQNNHQNVSLLCRIMNAMIVVVLTNGFPLRQAAKDRSQTDNFTELHDAKEINLAKLRMAPAV